MLLSGTRPESSSRYFTSSSEGTCSIAFSRDVTWSSMSDGLSPDLGGNSTIPETQQYQEMIGVLTMRLNVMRAMILRVSRVYVYL